MTPARLTRLWAVALLAGATGLFSLLGIVALNAGGRAGVGPLVFLRLAAGADRRADALLAGPRVPTGEDRREAADLSRQAIAEYPYDTTALLRLAYLDALDHRQLTREGLGYLKRSYDLVPADPALGVWRIRFALNNFAVLTPDVQESVKREVRIMWTSPMRRWRLQNLPREIDDPRGRIMLVLWAYRLDRNETI